MQVMRGLSLVASCAIAAMAIPNEAVAAVLCQKKTGAILVRPDACKKKETAFDLSPFVAASTAVTNLTTQLAAADQRYLHETTVVTGAGSTDASSNDAELTVACPAGYQATGGGVAGEFNQIGVDASGPTIGGQPTNTLPAGMSGAPDGWFARVFSFQGDAEPFKVSVICVKPGP